MVDQCQKKVCTNNSDVSPLGRGLGFYVFAPSRGERVAIRRLTESRVRVMARTV